MLNLNRLGSPFKPGEALTKKKQPPSGKKLSETEMNSQRFHKVFTSLFPNSQKIKEKHTYTLDSEIRQCIENLKQKVEEKDGDVEEEKKEEEISIYKVDGVPYELSGEEIMDPEDFSPIGKIDGKGGIIFEDEEAEETHKKNIDKYA